MNANDNLDILAETTNETEEDGLSPSQVLEIMEQSWLNEKFCPEILPHKQDIVECLLGQINYLDENLQNVGNTDFRKSIHQLEMDRIRYLVSSYLRKRLEKIETYVFDVMAKEHERLEKGELPYLTEDEMKFAINYKQALEQHFGNVTNFCPTLNVDEWNKNHIAPNLHSFVFLKSKSNIEGIVIENGRDDSDLIDLYCGSQVIMSYSSIANLLKNGNVHLI